MPTFPGWSRFRVDTTLLSDGPHTLELMASNEFVKTRTKRYLFVVDNANPVITLLEGEGWTNNGNYLRVSGTVSKPVQEIFAEVNGVQIDEPFAVNNGAFAFGLSVPCDAKHDVVLRTIDSIGNSGERAFSILCDTNPPTIAWRTTNYRPEFIYKAVSKDGWMEAETWKDHMELIDPGKKQVVTLRKFLHKLDFLPAQGLDSTSQNLPTLAAVASDSGIAGVHDNFSMDVRCEYRYFVGAQEIRPWTPMACPNGQIELPVAYQTTDADLWRLDRTQKLEMRAVDLAGNVSETLGFEFKMRTYLPRVTISDCTVAPELTRHNLQELLSLFDKASRTVAYRANIRWDVPLPEGSMAPVGEANVTLRGGTGSWNVSRVAGKVGYFRGDDFPKIENQRGACWPTLGAGPYDNIIVNGAAKCSHTLTDVDSVCNGSVIQGSAADKVPDTDYCKKLSANVRHQHTGAEYRVFEDTGEGRPRTNGFSIAPNTLKSLEVTMTDPVFESVVPNLSKLEGQPMHVVPFVRARMNFIHSPNGVVVPAKHNENLEYEYYAKAIHFDFSEPHGTASYRASAHVGLDLQGTCAKSISANFTD